VDVEGLSAKSAECNGLKGSGEGIERRLRLLAPQEEVVVAEEDVQRRRRGRGRGGEDDEKAYTRFHVIRKWNTKQKSLEAKIS